MSFSLNAATTDLPDLICHLSDTVQINPRNNNVVRYESRDVYRIHSGQLYISSPDRTEYRYNTISKVEHGRFVSGHKTIQFDAYKTSFNVVTFVHVNFDEVRLSRGTCSEYR